MVGSSNRKIGGDILIIDFAPKLGFFPRSGEKSKAFKIFLKSVDFPQNWGKSYSKIFSSNPFSIRLSGLKTELFYSPIDYVCP